MALKDLRYMRINGASPLYLIVGKINGHFEEINENKYLENALYV